VQFFPYETRINPLKIPDPS